MEQAAFATLFAGSAAILAGYGIARLESKFRAMFPKAEKPNQKIYHNMPKW